MIYINSTHKMIKMKTSMKCMLKEPLERIENIKKKTRKTLITLKNGCTNWQK